MEIWKSSARMQFVFETTAVVHPRPITQRPIERHSHHIPLQSSIGLNSKTFPLLFFSPILVIFFIYQITNRLSLFLIQYIINDKGSVKKSSKDSISCHLTPFLWSISYFSRLVTSKVPIQMDLDWSLKDIFRNLISTIILYSRTDQGHRWNRTQPLDVSRL